MSQNNPNVTSTIVPGDLHLTRNRFKIAVVGESSSGKTSLIRRFVWNVYDDQVQDAEPKQVLQQRIGGRLSKVELIEIDAESLFVDDDRTDEERKRLRSGDDWIDVDAILLLYDTTCAGSFDRSVDWIKILARRVSPTCEMCFVGTKCDMKETRKVSFKQADAVAERLTLSLFEVSAKTSINCVVCLEEVVERSNDRRQPHIESFVSEVVYPTEQLSSTLPPPSPNSTNPSPERSLFPSIFCLRWWSK